MSSEGITCYERDETLCEDQMCLRTGCRLRNVHVRAKEVANILMDMRTPLSVEAAGIIRRLSSISAPAPADDATALAEKNYGDATHSAILKEAFIEGWNARATPTPASAVSGDVREALVLAEDILSRAPFSTQVWPNGMHPQEGISKIRAALSSAGK